MNLKIEIYALPALKITGELDDAGFGATISSVENPSVEINITAKATKFDLVSRIPAAIFMLEKEIEIRKGLPDASDIARINIP